MFKILLVLFIGLSVYFSKDQVLAHSEISVIEMTPNGFEPSRVKIDVNSSVIFLNKDSEPRWPASNTHPTHELYPEFDHKKAIMPGESWPFKPNRVGQWKYHDHLFPHFRGVLVVTSEGEDLANQTKPEEIKISFVERVRNIFNNLFSKIGIVFRSTSKQTNAKLPDTQAFKNLKASEQENALMKIAKDFGAKKSWEYVKLAFKNDAGSSGNIHDLAHLSGIMLYEEKVFEGLKDCSSNFAFGCYHGFLDKAFAKNLDYLITAQNACLKLGPENSGPVASCIHGIGHGVASFYSTADLEKSLSTCRKLTSGNEFCFDGVFMEFVRSASDSFFRRDDPYYPCNSLEEKFGYSYSFTCGRNQPSLLMGRFKIPFAAVAQICVNATSKPFQEGCVDSLGFFLAATLEPEKIIEGCLSLGISEFVENCIQKASGELVFQDAPNWEEKTQILCNSITDGTAKCHSYVNNLASEYNRLRK